MIKTSLDKISNKILIENQELEINIDGLDVFLKVFIKSDNNKLVVFSNGAVDRSVKHPPVFQRSTWHKNIDASCVFIDDKTIHNRLLNTGWGFGTPKRFYLKDYSKIIKKISNLLAISDENVTYYGSSAGGFMSIILATLHTNSFAIVNNPQIDLDRHFNPKSVNNLFNSVLPDVNRNEIIQQYPERINVVNNMIKENYVPNLVYIQNKLSLPDMKIHYNPFFDILDKNELDTSRIQSILYNNTKLGHNPLNQKTTEYFINAVVNNKLRF